MRKITAAGATREIQVGAPDEETLGQIEEYILGHPDELVFEYGGYSVLYCIVPDNPTAEAMSQRSPRRRAREAWSLWFVIAQSGLSVSLITTDEEEAEWYTRHPSAPVWLVGQLVEKEVESEGVKRTFRNLRSFVIMPIVEDNGDGDEEDATGAVAGTEAEPAPVRRKKTTRATGYD